MNLVSTRDDDDKTRCVEYKGIWLHGSNRIAAVAGFLVSDIGSTYKPYAWYVDGKRCYICMYDT